MRRATKLFLVAATVWTYGSEALDTLAERTEWDWFSAELQCEVRKDQVYCLVNNEWYTIDNQLLPVPWPVE